MMSLRWYCACVAIVHCGACREGDRHCGKTDSFPIAFDCRMGLTGDGGWGVLLFTSAVIGQQREHVCLPVRAVIKLHTWMRPAL